MRQESRTGRVGSYLAWALIIGLQLSGCGTPGVEKPSVTKSCSDTKILLSTRQKKLQNEIDALRRQVKKSSQILESIDSHFNILSELPQPQSATVGDALAGNIDNFRKKYIAYRNDLADLSARLPSIESAHRGTEIILQKPCLSEVDTKEIAKRQKEISRLLGALNKRTTKVISGSENLQEELKLTLNGLKESCPGQFLQQMAHVRISLQELQRKLSDLTNALSKTHNEFSDLKRLVEKHTSMSATDKSSLWMAMSKEQLSDIESNQTMISQKVREAVERYNDLARETAAITKSNCSRQMSSLASLYQDSETLAKLIATQSLAIQKFGSELAEYRNSEQWAVTVRLRTPDRYFRDAQRDCNASNLHLPTVTIALASENQTWEAADWQWLESVNDQEAAAIRWERGKPRVIVVYKDRHKLPYRCVFRGINQE